MDATPLPAATDAPPAAAGEEHRVTPLMEQYVEIKAANPDCLLFYRMGDFYELFFGDAEVASRALGIVLTKRGKHRGQDIPMCGVPVERADDYLHRLITLGHRVAVCEQVEDPAEAKKRGGKSVVRRDVVRLVTPGTLTEDSLLDARRNNYLVAIARAKLSADGDSQFALAFLDISTGEFRLTECDRNGLPAELARLEPGEIIVSDALYGDAEVAPLLRALPVSPLGRDVFDGATAERRLAAYFAVATTDAFGALSRLELTAAAACITYVERTQIGKRPPLSPPTREAAGATLAIDAATRTNLELMRTQTGERRGSLIGAIDRTVTVAGARLLSQRLAAPLTDPDAIGRRLDAVELFSTDALLRADIRERLAAVPDLARALSRLVVGRGGPRDLAAIRDGLGAAVELRTRLAVAPPVADIIDAMAALQQPDPAIAAELTAALGEELPLFKRDGGFVGPQYDAALDETRALRDESRRVVAALQARYAEDTEVKSLKIRHNNVLGYFRRGHCAARRQAPEPAMERDLHPPPDAGRAGPLHLDGAGRAGSQDRQRGGPRAGPGAGDLRTPRRPRGRGRGRHQGRRLCARRGRRRRRAGDARGRARLCAAGGRREPRFRHRGRAPSRGRAGAGARRRAVRRQ